MLDFDAYPSLLEKLIVNVNPVQYGTGTPSPTNIREIKRYDGAKVRISGKNMIDSDFLLQADGWTKDSFGVYSGSTIELRNAFRYGVGGVPQFADLQITDQITISFEAYGSNGTNSIYCYFYYTDETYDRITVNSGDWALFTLTSNPSKTVKTLSFSYSNNQTARIRKFQIEKGNTATTYEPYHGTEHTIDWSSFDIGSGLKPYGGVLNVLTGEFVVTKVGMELDGTESWARIGSPRYRFYTPIVGVQTIATPTDDTRGCSHFPNDDVPNTTNNGFYAYNYASDRVNIVFRNYPDITAVADWKSFLAAQYAAGTPVTIWFEVNPYITLNLTPEQVQALLTNVIYADTGDITVGYLE